MFCTKCGTELSEGSKFCFQCGQAVNQTFAGGQKIKLCCNDCGGVMDVNVEVTGNYSMLVCQYCGSKKMVLESNKVAVQKIKSNTHREIELQRIQTQKELSLEQTRFEKQKNEELKKEKFQNGVISKIIVISILLCMAFCCWNMSRGRWVIGIMLLIVTVLCILAWFQGMGITKGKRNYGYGVFLLMSMVCIIPTIYFGYGDTVKQLVTKFEASQSYEWSEIILKDIMPIPESGFGEIYINSEVALHMVIDEISTSQYNAYIKDCQKFGFETDGIQIANAFYGFNKAGYSLLLSHNGNRMTIQLEEPMEFEKEQWPTNDIIKGLPVPKSEYLNIFAETETEINIFVGETSLDTYTEYIEECIEEGFTKEYKKSKMSYYAEYNKGLIFKTDYGLTVEYIGNNIMYINVKELS